MFSRRHPYLFSLLIFSSIAALVVLSISVLLFLSGRAGDLAALSGGGDRVGVIEIAGVISDARDVLEKIKRFREAPAIKAIVLRIDSPGGAVGPSQEIYREVIKTRPVKPVIASMGAVAASGGYYLAAAADGIVASSGTITGSIGVIMGYTNFQQILERIGLVPVVVKSGEYKDMGSPVRQMTETERALLQELVDAVHRQFVRDVAQGRKMDPSLVEPWADGRIFTGERALELGLVDRIGNLEDAVEWAGRRGGIRGGIDTVYAPEKKFSLLKYLIGAFYRSVFDATLYPVLPPAYLHVPGR